MRCPFHNCALGQNVLSLAHENKEEGTQRAVPYLLYPCTGVRHDPVLVFPQHKDKTSISSSRTVPKQNGPSVGLCLHPFSTWASVGGKHALHLSTAGAAPVLQWTLLVPPNRNSG